MDITLRFVGSDDDMAAGRDLCRDDRTFRPALGNPDAPVVLLQDPTGASISRPNRLPEIHTGQRAATLVATVDGSVIGRGLPQRLVPDVQPVRRRFSRPLSWGPGPGRRLSAALIELARVVGTHALWLDTGRRMTAASARALAIGCRERDVCTGLLSDNAPCLRSYERPL